jgi:hypothetical protein
MVTSKTTDAGEKSEEPKTASATKTAKKTASKRAGSKKPAKGPAAKKSAKPANGGLSKADFVRKYPNLSASEILDTAKAQGFKLGANNIYMTRSQDERTAGGKKSKAGEETAKKTGRKPVAAKPVEAATPKAKGKPPVLAQLVLKLQADHPTWTKKKIAKAAKCSPTYAYNVLRKGALTPAPRATRKTAAPVASNSDVTDFYKVVKKVGVPKAKELIAIIEAYESA